MGFKNKKPNKQLCTKGMSVSGNLHVAYEYSGAINNNMRTVNVCSCSKHIYTNSLPVPKSDLNLIIDYARLRATYLKHRLWMLKLQTPFINSVKYVNASSKQLSTENCIPDNMEVEDNQADDTEQDLYLNNLNQKQDSNINDNVSNEHFSVVVKNIIKKIQDKSRDDFIVQCKKNIQSVLDQVMDECKDESFNSDGYFFPDASTHIMESNRLSQQLSSLYDNKKYSISTSDYDIEKRLITLVQMITLSSYYQIYIIDYEDQQNRRDKLNIQEWEEVFKR